MSFLNNYKVSTKLWIVTGLSIFFALTLQLYALNQSHQQLVDSRHVELRHIVESASAITAHYHAQSASLGTDVAQQKAKEAIAIFPDNQARKCLEDIVDFCIERAY